MKKIIFGLTILFVITAAIKAESITVENYSFEEPDVGKIIGWDQEDGAMHVTEDNVPIEPAEVPSWNSDGPVSSSGVESGWPGCTDCLLYTSPSPRDRS